MRLPHISTVVRAGVLVGAVLLAMITFPPPGSASGAPAARTVVTMDIVQAAPVANVPIVPILCEFIPNPVLRSICINKKERKVIVKQVKHVVVAVASAATNAIISTWTAPLRDWASFLGSGIVKMIALVPPPDTQADITFHEYEKTLGLEYGLLGLVFVVGLLFCMNNAKRLLKLLAATFYALVGGIFAPAVFEILIIASNEISKSVSGDFAAFAGNLGALFGMSFGGPVVGGFLLTWCMLAFGALLFWENVFRSAGVPVLTILVPLALLGLFLGEWGHSVLRKLTFFILGLIISQPITVIMLNAGISIGGGYNANSAITSLVRGFFGVTIVAIAAFMPFIIAKELPVVAAKLRDAGRIRAEGGQAKSAAESAENKRSITQKLVNKIPGLDNPALPIVASAITGNPATGVAVTGAQEKLRSYADRGQSGSGGSGKSRLPKVETITMVDPESGEVTDRRHKITEAATMRQTVTHMHNLQRVMGATQAAA